MTYEQLLKQLNICYKSGGLEAVRRWIASNLSLTDLGFLAYLEEKNVSSELLDAWMAGLNDGEVRLRKLATTGPLAVDPADARVVRRFLVDLMAVAPNADTALGLLEQYAAWGDVELINVAREMISTAHENGMKGRAEFLERWTEAMERYFEYRATIPTKLNALARSEAPADEAKQWSEVDILEAQEYLLASSSYDSPADPLLTKRLTELARRIADRTTVAKCLFVLGVAYLHRHDSLAAIKAFEACLEAYPAPEAENLHQIWGNLATAHQEAGHPKVAKAILQRLIDVKGNHPATRQARFNALINLATVEREAGHFDRSESLLEHVLEEQWLGSDVRADTHLRLANLHLLRGRLSWCLKHLSEARQWSTDRFSLQVDAVLGSCLERLGLDDEASEILRRVRETFAASDDPFSAARIDDNLARMALLNDQLDEAERLARSCLTVHQNLGDHDGATTAHIILGTVAARRRDHVAAGEHFATAGLLAEALNDGLASLTAVQELISALRESRDPGLIDWTRRAVDTLRNIRSGLIDPETRAGFFHTAQFLLNRHAELCIAAGSDHRHEAAMTIDEANSWMHLDELRTSRAELTNIDIRSVTDDTLDPATGILILGGYGTHQYAFLLEGEEYSRPFQLPSTQLLERMQSLFNLLEGFGKIGNDRLAQAKLILTSSDAFAQLHAAVVQTEIWQELAQRNFKRLVITGAPQWLGLPWHALSLTADGPPLIEHYSEGISYAPSLGVFRLCQHEMAKFFPHLQQFSWRVFADPERGNKARELPGSAREMKAFDVEGNSLVGSDVTFKAVIGSLHNEPLFAFIGHGVLDEGDAMDTGLVLAPSKDGSSIRITARDVLELHDSVKLQTRVAYLSACHAGFSSIAPSRPMSGFARSLLSAGCLAVIAPSWPVDDEIAPLFTEAFANALTKGNRLGKAVSAGVAAIRAERPQPFHWAGYRLFGSL